MFSSSVVCVGNVITFNGACHVGCITFKITCYVFAILKRIQSRVELYLWSNPDLVSQFVIHAWWQYVKGGGKLKYFPKVCVSVELTTYCVKTSCRIERRSCLLKLFKAFLTVLRIM
jgi:hypothetical protein